MPADVVIVGGGTMGCAAAWALARRGAKVRVLERFSHVHDRGSHGGFTRVIRHAYHEGAGYVRLVDEADRQWQALGERVGHELLARRGLLEFGRLDDPEYRAALHSLEQHAVPHERLSPAEAARRWPVQIPEDYDVSFTPQSGFLRVAACLDALRAEAQSAGARFEYGVHVREVVRPTREGEPPRVLLDDGRLIPAQHIVVAAGAYAQQLLPRELVAGPRGRTHALRRVLAWTMPAPEQRAATAAMPVWAGFVPEGFFYGFPFGRHGPPDDAGDASSARPVTGFKLACHVSGAHVDTAAECDPETVDREVDERDLAPLEAFLRDYLPAAQGPFVHTEVCMYGQSQDGDFIVDLHPDDPRIVVCAGFSGHGFKFAPTIGMLVADLVERGRSDWQLPRFRLGPATVGRTDTAG